MNAPQKPDANAFARETLHHLAALGGEVSEVKHLLTEVLGHLKSLPSEQFQDRWKDHREKMTAGLYLESLTAANIPVPSDDPPDDDPPPRQAQGGDRIR